MSQTVLSIRGRTGKVRTDYSVPLRLFQAIIATLSRYRRRPVTAALMRSVIAGRGVTEVV